MVIPYRDLPVPASGRITVEMVREIKAIPDEETRFTEAQVAWMRRVIENIDYLMTQEWDRESLQILKDEVLEALELHRQHLIKDAEQI